MTGQYVFRTKAPRAPHHRLRRSQRLEGLVDRTLHDFLCHHWFHVEVGRIDNVPDDGGALLVCNHTSSLLPGEIMIAKALR